MSSSSVLKERIRSDYVATAAGGIGSKLPTIKDLANRYGVSAPTIGKAVELLAAEGWLAKRRGSGLYVARPSNETPSSRGQGSRRIGYITHNLNTKLSHYALEGVAQVVGNNNGILELAKTNWQIEEERRQIAMMRERGVQGIVLYPTAFRPVNEEYLGREFRDFPIVVIDLYHSAMRRPHVIFDNLSAGRDMTRYLLFRKCREIAFIKFEDEVSFRSVDDRVAGYRQALKDAGIPSRHDLVISFESRTDFKYKNFLAGVEQLLLLEPRPQAIIVPYDGLVPVTINYLRARGINVPHDMIVAGFDNLQSEQLEHWPTTNNDFLRMGERAAEILFERIETHNPGISESILSCSLVLPEESSVKEVGNSEIQEFVPV